MKEEIKDERKAYFTSSKIHMLMTDGSRPMTPEEKQIFQDNGGDKRKKNCFDYGKPFYTYVQSKIFERMVGRSLNNEARAKSLDWGYLCEQIAHDEIGLEYQLVSKKRYTHLDLAWSGMPDGIVESEDNRVVTDIKCPFTLNSFMSLYYLIYDSNPDTWAEVLKENKPEWYWQLISNSILANASICELILFMPKRSMLQEIRLESEKSGKYYFHKKDDYELPWTADESFIDTVTYIRFDAPKEDQEALTARVEAADKLLNPITE